MHATLSSDRLLIRPLQETDAPEILLLRSDKRVNEYLDRDPATSLADALSFIRTILGKQVYYWGICLKGENRLIGTACLWNVSPDGQSAELGFELNPEFWKKGYMQEALGCLLVHAFKELRLQFIEAHTHPENKNSANVLLKNGFVRKDRPAEMVSENLDIYILSHRPRAKGF